MKATIVTTTIYVPHFLTEYAAAADRNGHEITFIVIGDEKTPPEAKSFCAKIPNCVYHDIGTQDYYLLNRSTALMNHIPHNSVERRNIGMMMAYEHGDKIVITLDDDNYATIHDAIEGHGIVGHTASFNTIGSSTGWFNPCTMLKERNGVEFYHRGYPPAHRWEYPTLLLEEEQTNRVVVNAGLWIDNPDVDAITRLERELTVIGFKDERLQRIALAPGTWSPFNCQNTALHCSVIPAYFLSPAAGRHADIFASYVVNKIAGHLGDVIAFGYPLARHTRSPHDLWKDLDAERGGIQATDQFCAILRSIELTADNYHECFGEIARSLKDRTTYPMIEKVAEGMLIWHEAFKELL